MFRRVATYLAGRALDESGSTAMEYGFLAALIGIAIILGVKAFGLVLAGFFGPVGLP